MCHSTHYRLLQQMIFPANHLTGAKMVFLTYHFTGTSKSNLTATKVRHKNLNSCFKKVLNTHTKLNMKKLKPDLCGFYAMLSATGLDLFYRSRACMGLTS